MSSQKENDWQISRPFGPSVFKVKIHQKMVDKLNEAHGNYLPKYH